MSTAIACWRTLYVASTRSGALRLTTHTRLPLAAAFEIATPTASVLAALPLPVTTGTFSCSTSGARSRATAAYETSTPAIRTIALRSCTIWFLPLVNSLDVIIAEHVQACGDHRARHRLLHRQHARRRRYRPAPGR